MKLRMEKYRLAEKEFEDRNPIVGKKCENCCDNCIKFEHPDDGHMSCKIYLRTFAHEFERAVKSLNFDGTRPEGFGFGEPAHLSWMEMFALIRTHQRFTAVYGCNLFEKKDRSYVYDV